MADTEGIQAQKVFTPQKKKRSLLLFGLLAFFLIGVVYVVATLSAGRTTFFGKAASSGVFNAGNSYVFVSPVVARVGGDKIRVTIFALDGQGRGVANRNVTVNCKDVNLCQTAQIAIVAVQANTDSLGQALYDVSSPTAGKYELQAAVDGVAVPQTVTIVFQ